MHSSFSSHSHQNITGVELYYAGEVKSVELTKERQSCYGKWQIFHTTRFTRQTRSGKRRKSFLQHHRATPQIALCNGKAFHQHSQWNIWHSQWSSSCVCSRTRTRGHGVTCGVKRNVCWLTSHTQVRRLVDLGRESWAQFRMNQFAGDD